MLSITGSPDYVNTDAVDLQITADDDSGAAGVEMCVAAAAGGCAGAGGWGPVASRFSFGLGGTDGLKTAYVYLRDQAGNAAPPLTASVVRDTQPPAASVAIAGAPSYVASQAVTLAITALDGNAPANRALNSGVLLM